MVALGETTSSVFKMLNDSFPEQTQKLLEEIKYEDSNLEKPVKDYVLKTHVETIAKPNMMWQLLMEPNITPTMDIIASHLLSELKDTKFRNELWNRPFVELQKLAYITDPVVPINIPGS